MKISLSLAAALLASAALSQDVKKAEPPTRVLSSVETAAKDRVKLALPAPIAFSRAGAQKGIWRRETSGAEKRLTTGDDSSPTSYSGGRIYFTRKIPNGMLNAHSVNRDGSDERFESGFGDKATPWAGVTAFLEREPGTLGKIWLCLKVGDATRRLSSVGWTPRGYYFTQPAFEPGTSRIVVGSYERDDGNSKPKVKVRAFDFNGNSETLWSGVASGVGRVAMWREGGILHRILSLQPEGEGRDLWSLDGGAAPKKLVATPELERDVATRPDGKLLIGVEGKIYYANKSGTGRILVTEGDEGIWLD